jgi:hypothetical protein
MFDFALVDFAKANCKEQPTTWWFPEYPPTKINGATTVMAKKICSTCVIKEECLAYGQATFSYGIWGGFTLTAGHVGRRIKRKPTQGETE